MKTKKVCIVLFSLIALNACGFKNARNTAEKSTKINFDPTTAPVINTISTNTSAGRTQLIIVAGNPQSPVSLPPIGRMNYLSKEVNYFKGEKGNPEPQIKNTISDQSFPVYFADGNEGDATLIAVAPKELKPHLVPTNFKSDMVEYQYAKETRCVYFTIKMQFSQMFRTAECKFLEQTCRVGAGDYNIPIEKYRNDPEFECTQYVDDFTKSEVVSNSIDSDSLAVTLDPDQNAVRIHAKIKKNNVLVNTQSLFSFKESKITFKLSDSILSQ